MKSLSPWAATLNPWQLPSRLLLRYLAAIFLSLFLLYNYLVWTNPKAWDPLYRLRATISSYQEHPIRKLMIDAHAHHEALLTNRSHSVAEAAARYRRRRGRHPPPGFDEWMEFALESDAIIVEDFFDRIYKDLAPFWALEPGVLSKRANSWHWVVKVRNGTARYQGDVEGRVPWLELWTNLVGEFASHLPDVDMPINYMDESRILVPHEDIEEMVKVERQNRHFTPTSKVTTNYTRLTGLDLLRLKAYDPEWLDGDNNYWELARQTCGPDTPARNIEQIQLNTTVEYPTKWTPDYAYKGFIKNWTASMDPCLQPHLRYMHGTFVEPISLSTSQELIPLFGGSKLPMNNEILIPGAMYLTDNEFYSGGEEHGPPWANKTDGLIWRGDATGGRYRPGIWQHYQRHRLVEMLNGTTVTKMEVNGTKAKTFNLPSKMLYPSALRNSNQLGNWLTNYTNAGFVHLICEEEGCDPITPYYEELPGIPMGEQYAYKFLPDADGNSFSARFRGFLRSTSAPLKATIYAEWHDDRLAPWLHFVPLDNTFQDLYAALEHFADGPGGEGDAAAQFIAEQGQAWAERVLRREDMRLYVWRLLLEWARVCSEKRDTLGFVQDLVEERRKVVRIGGKPRPDK